MYLMVASNRLINLSERSIDHKTSTSGVTSGSLVSAMVNTQSYHAKPVPSVIRYAIPLRTLPARYPQPLKQVRYPKRIMSDTVCIAATCVDQATRRYFAILCSDSRIEIEGVASGNIGHKAVGIAAGMSAMFAGNVPKSKELIDRYIQLFKDPQTQRTEENILELLCGPLDCQHRADAEAYLSANYGMDYDEWLELDVNAQQNLIAGLQHWRTYCQLIMVWLGPQFVRLFLITDRVEEISSFTAIGTGTNAALTSLFLREYATYHNLAQAIYYVYEAKRSSESVPGVGKDTHLMILEFGGANRGSQNIYYPLNSGELDRLAQQYARFGPRPYERVTENALDLSFFFGG